MSPRTHLGFGLVCVVMAIVGVLSTRRLWYGDARVVDRLVRSWDWYIPLPRSVIHHIVRAIPVMCAASVLVPLGGFLFKWWETLGFLVIMTGFLAGTLGQLSIVVFNRPKWCVPPYLRNEAGLGKQVVAGVSKLLATFRR